MDSRGAFEDTARPGMTNIPRTLILATTLAGLLRAAETLPTRDPVTDELTSAIHHHIGQDRFRDALWGIKIESLDTGKVLFEHNANKLLKPASNAKLFTAALALDRLGPERRLRTSFFALHPPSRSGTIRDDLYIYGRGDFSFAARFHDGDYSASLLPLVEALKTAGVRRVRGGLVGDATYFRGPPHGSSWTVDDLQHYYGAEVSALVCEDNTVDLVLRPGPALGSPCEIETRPETRFLTFINQTHTTGPDEPRLVRLYRPLSGNVVHVHGQLPLRASSWSGATPVFDAPLWFVSRLENQLRHHGIGVAKTPRAIDWLTPESARPDYKEMVEITVVDSPPVRELVRAMMKSSQNLYAQTLFLLVGREGLSSVAPDPFLTTEGLANTELHEFLVRYGIPTNSVHLDEGSGLSRRALVTPDAIVQLLKLMDRHPQAQHFLDSLPVAGVDGTLRRRMNGTPAEGAVRGKTGSLAHVSALSGYVTTRSGERLVFSFMLNHHLVPDPQADLDTLAILLASGWSDAAKEP
jgi:D-alanyl-D-alanine carboxypeptidase/D-alanyl-D-alanine-endopeptidase (penicillin-binding protein 4)